MKRDSNTADRLSDLAARIDRLDQAAAPPVVKKVERARPPREAISPREKLIRRWVLGAFLVWGLLIYGLMVLQRWGSASTLDLVLGFPFMLVCVAGCYGFHLFYAELGKSVWRKVRSGRSEN